MSQQIIWLTGASSGLGLALAKQLCRNKDCVIGTARDYTQLKRMKAELGENFIPLPGDIADDESMARVAQQLPALTQKLDKVILNAGVCEYIDDCQLDVERFQRVFDVNVFGAVRCLKIALPLLRNAPQAQIVGIGSLTTHAAFPRAEAYGASKAALRYLLESLRADLSRENISVTVVSPGFIATPMIKDNDFPMPFTKTADAVAAYLVKKLPTFPYHIVVPRRLAWLLTAASVIPSLWFECLAPRMTRTAARGRL